MVTRFWRKLGWHLHRWMCGVGIHAAEGVSEWFPAADDLDDEWVVVGWYCSACRKQWEIE